MDPSPRAAVSTEWYVQPCGLGKGDGTMGCTQVGQVQEVGVHSGRTGAGDRCVQGGHRVGVCIHTGSSPPSPTPPPRAPRVSPLPVTIRRNVVAGSMTPWAD